MRITARRPSSIRCGPRSSRRSSPARSSLRIDRAGRPFRPDGECLVLHPSTDLVQALPTRTTWKGPATRMAWSTLGDSPARKDSARSVATNSMPAIQSSSTFFRPSPQVSYLVALDQIDQHLGPQVDHAGDVDRFVVPARRKTSSTPSWVTAPMRPGSFTSAVPCSMTAFMTVHPAHAELGRHPGGRSGLLTYFATCLGTGPAGSRAWVSTWSECSVQVLASRLA